jgi:hypothetical protein
MDADTQEEFNRVDDEITEIQENIDAMVEEHLVTSMLLRVALAELARLDPRFAFAMQTAANALITQRYADAETISTVCTDEGRTRQFARAAEFEACIKAMLEPLRAQVSAEPSRE